MESTKWSYKFIDKLEQLKGKKKQEYSDSFQKSQKVAIFTKFLHKDDTYNDTRDMKIKMIKVGNFQY